MVPEDRTVRRVAVIGATSLIGDFLLPRLLEAGYEVHALSRKPPSDSATLDVVWHCSDIKEELPAILHDVDVLIHLAPLATLPPLLYALGEKAPKRVIGFGTTSLFTKGSSSLPEEQSLVQGLRDSEALLSDFGARHGVSWTVFRPTLVYHLGRDKNVTTIAYFLRKFGCFALVGGGGGKRQPVHAEDLAIATISAIESPRTFGQAYNLSGAEILSYRSMVERIAESLGIKPRIINIPLPLLKTVISLVSIVPKFRYLNTEMATRIMSDMCFDHADARRDFGYSPRSFLTGPKD